MLGIGINGINNGQHTNRLSYATKNTLVKRSRPLLSAVPHSAPLLIHALHDSLLIHALHDSLGKQRRLRPRVVDVQDEEFRAGKTVQLLGQLGVGVPRSAGDAAKRLCVDEQHARLAK